MSALPPSQMRAMCVATAKANQPALSLQTRWEVLHERARKLGDLAGLSEEPQGASIDGLLESANDWQRGIAERGIEDLDALMATGMRALATLTQRGLDASTPAMTLWREFYHARETVLSVLQPHCEAA